MARIRQGPRGSTPTPARVPETGDPGRGYSRTGVRQVLDSGAPGGARVSLGTTGALTIGPFDVASVSRDDEEVRVGTGGELPSLQKPSSGYDRWDHRCQGELTEHPLPDLRTPSTLPFDRKPALSYLCAGVDNLKDYAKLLRAAGDDAVADDVEARIKRIEDT